MSTHEMKHVRQAYHVIFKGSLAETVDNKSTQFVMTSNIY
jgi:hypothetical protein